jgi:hypothetical protein
LLLFAYTIVPTNVPATKQLQASFTKLQVLDAAHSSSPLSATFLITSLPWNLPTNHLTPFVTIGRIILNMNLNTNPIT